MTNYTAIPAASTCDDGDGDDGGAGFSGASYVSSCGSVWCACVSFSLTGRPPPLPPAPRLDRACRFS